LRKLLNQFFLKKLSGDFVQRAGGNFGGWHAQSLGLGKNELAFEAKFLC
jgi:hypothetical protein